MISTCSDIFRHPVGEGTPDQALLIGSLGITRNEAESIIPEIEQIALSRILQALEETGLELFDHLRDDGDAYYRARAIYEHFVFDISERNYEAMLSQSELLTTTGHWHYS